MPSRPEATRRALRPKRELEREETVEACALTAILYRLGLEEVEEFFGREAKRSCRG